jgi:hypothetical protein
MHFIRLIVEGRPLLYHTFSLCSCILYLMMVGRTTETSHREITIKGRIAFGCCVGAEWSAIDGTL